MNSQSRVASLGDASHRAHSVSATWRRERSFFVGIALAGALAVVVGFAPTYYLKGMYGAPALPALVHVHGALFSAWIVFVITQTLLVAVRRTDLHQRLGVAGGILAVAMTVVAYWTAIAAVQRGRMDPGFLAVALGSVVVFPSFVGVAILWRTQPDWHKRFMLLATVELLPAAIGRWPLVRDWGAFGSYAVTDVFLAALVVYDFSSIRRVHPATILAGFILVAFQFLRETLRYTETWLAFAAWLTT